MKESGDGPVAGAGDGPVVLMWEARVQPGRLDEVLGYLRERAWPAWEGQEGYLSGELYCAEGEAGVDERTGERVVVILRWRDGPAMATATAPGSAAAAALGATPYLARAAHSWPFRLVSTG